LVGAVDHQMPPSAAVFVSSVATPSSGIVNAASGQSVIAPMPVLQPPVKVWQQSVTQDLRNHMVDNL